MGVSGLSSFMTQNPDTTQPFKLHDTTVILDGSNLIHSLYHNYNVEFKYGGEYRRYYDCVRRFMSNFLKCDVNPIVIFDGGLEKDDQKLNFSLERAEKTLERAQIIARGEEFPPTNLPLLAYEVFYSVISDLNITFANCDYAADGQVAALGNYYDCPVISSNSDFFIFDSHKGFIHLDFIGSTINSEVGSDGRKYKFLDCRIYYIHEFVKAFTGLDKSILPLFGTLLGTEFVEPETFDNFFAKIRLPKYEGKRVSFNLRNNKVKNIVGLLCWLRNKSLKRAVNEVTSYFEKNEQEYIKSVIDISVSGYKLNPCSLTFILNKKLDDPRNDLLAKSKIITPCGSQLPQKFILEFHKAYLPSFFINVIGLHRVILQAQVEDAELSSSHSCSSYIRRLLYGILVRHDINGAECKNQGCLGFIEEYDRQDSSIKKNNVLPLFELEGIGLLPKLSEVYSIGEEKCIAIIAAALGVGSDFFLHIPDAWQLFIGSINYWLRISGCRSDAFISSVLLNLIYFGLIKCKNPFTNQKLCPKKLSTSNKCSCSSITCIATNVSKFDLKQSEKKLKEFYITPTLTRNIRLFRNISHSFSQLQSCLLHITFLNQLFNEPLESPAPEKCFSGTMLHNLTETIAFSSSGEHFIRDVLGKDLNLLFTQLKCKIYENVPNLNL